MGKKERTIIDKAKEDQDIVMHVFSSSWPTEKMAWRSAGKIILGEIDREVGGEGDTEGIVGHTDRKTYEDGGRDKDSDTEGTVDWLMGRLPRKQTTMDDDEGINNDAGPSQLFCAVGAPRGGLYWRLESQ